MWKIFSKTCSLAAILACTGGIAAAQSNSPDQNGAIFVPQSSSSSSFNQQGFNLPSAPRATGQDIIRGSGGISCQSAIGGNGPTLDMGVIGTNDIYDRDSAALYGRVTIQLGKKSKRVDCNRLYDLEVERLKMELALMRAGSIGSQAPYSDPAAVRNIMTQVAAPVTPTQSAEIELPESASISPFTLGGPQKAKPSGLETEKVDSRKLQQVQIAELDSSPAQSFQLQSTQKMAQPILTSPPLSPKSNPEKSAFYMYDKSNVVPNKLPAMAVTLANIGVEKSAPTGPTYFTQMGAFSTLENAQAAWAEYSEDVPKNLPEGYAFASPVVRGNKTLYLLQAGPFPKDVSKRVCASLKSGCFPVRT